PPARRWRRDRTQARLPRAGIQPRGQHAVRQGERCRSDQYRAGAEERGRAVPRTGPESGVRPMADAADTRASRGAVARRGLMFVLSSPSGAGKTTLSRMLLEADDRVDLSISVTTRPKRPGEIDGRHYHFIDAKRFEAMVTAGALVEGGKVFGHSYGTPRAPVEQALSGGHDVLFDIDWQGTQQLREKAPKDLVSVFVLPPSIPELERRLRIRAQDG